MPIVANVIIENTSLAFDNIYSYLVPADLEHRALVGCRIRVPFGRGNTSRTGFILDTEISDRVEKLKNIHSVLDAYPIVDTEGIAIMRHLKNYTFCTWFDALRLLIPTGLGIEGKKLYSIGEPTKEPLSQKQHEVLRYISTKRKPVEEKSLCSALDIGTDNKDLRFLVKNEYLIVSEELKQRIKDDRVTMVRPAFEPPTTKLTKRQMEVLDFVDENPESSVKEICYYAGASVSVLDNLEKKRQIEYYEVTRSRGGFDKAEPDNNPPPILSPAQQEVCDKLIDFTREEKPLPALLYGITGSGKTQVFLNVLEEALGTGKSAIVMVPEISLTSQTIRSMQGRFGNRVAVLHSGLSLGERMDEWKRIKSGDATIVVGTRSAVFAPVQNLGLIVIDEEQEHTYKSDKSPRFHARDIARLRSNYNSALLLLCSATPSVESYYQAINGRYKLLTLPDRFGKAELPHVSVIDMKQPENLSSSPTISAVLLEEIRYNLDHNEQSILLLNRRGYSTVVTCTACMTAAECPNCSVPMTYHTANGHLVCHYCGYSQEKITACQSCGSELIRYAGVGTQRLEEELKEIFTDAKILRMDMDTTMSRYSHERMFTAFKDGEYDIMIGTQMVAKGLNFPKVTLVGVLNADQSLYSDDFRSYERSFSLLTQVVGRSGRGTQPGRAFVQTWTPEHSIIQLSTKQNYPTFFREEILGRKLHLYPPFCNLTGIGFVGDSLDKVRQWSSLFSQQFQKLAKEEYSSLPIRLLGPTPCEVLKMAGKYRYKLIVKCRNDKTTREFLQNMVQWFYRECRDVSMYIDMYYERM